MADFFEKNRALLNIVFVSLQFEFKSFLIID